MKQEIKVPPMGESITEATVGALLKESGSAVKMDEEILELETDKVNQVLYAPAGGTLQLTVSVDDVVSIGQVIGFVDANGSAAAPAAPAKEVAPVAAPQPTATNGSVERMTKEAFIADVRGGSTPKAVAAPPVAPAAIAPVAAPAPRASSERETRQRMSKIRKVIAHRLVEAQQTTAMLTTFNEVDMSATMQLRKQYQDDFVKKHGIKLGFMSFFVRAVVSALKAFPGINSYIDGDEIVERHYYDIGIAVGTPRGLMVPIVRDCDGLNLAQIEQGIAGFAKRAREGGISVDDLQGGSFTITNGGIYGSMLSTPILNPPQSGILGMHNIVKRAVVVNDQIVIRPMMYLALS
ncbi:MAG: dihydrolipoyllysine-residue succinyltransferase, partial [Chlamydiia bacterium]|nr:dihydrolipoyllysine-residue succinyltransferase [Chlamydiia bacterium]